MKKILIAMCACACACAFVLSFTAAHAQGMRHRFRPEDTIGISARDVLRSYLNKEYRRNCSDQEKDAPEICDQTKPLYVGSSLNGGNAHPLPPEVMQKIGFVEPGTEYVQEGLVVYLISPIRHIILDEVDIHGDDKRP